MSFIKEMQRRKSFDEDWQEIRHLHYPMWELDRDRSMYEPNRFKLVTTKASDPMSLFDNAMMFFWDMAMVVPILVIAINLLGFFF